MISVCPGCGAFRPDRRIEPAGPVAICPECGHRQSFVQCPLLVVGGASGSGKSTICGALLGRVERAVVLDADLLWRAEFNRPNDRYADFFETWLRLAVAIGQSGRPVVLFGAGLGVPENLEGRLYRRYLGRIHYLVLICPDDVLAQRLRARPAWRDAGGDDFVRAQVDFNRWLRAEGPSAAVDYALVDTQALDEGQAAAQVADWIEARLGG